MSEQDYINRIKQLEAEVEHQRLGKLLYQQMVNDLYRDSVPFEPPTPEEEEAMINGPRGTPIIEIIRELERESA